MPAVMLNGQEGRIEAVYHPSFDKNAPLVICLHPNPLQGGTMNNKVTHAIYKSFAEMGCAVIKFNFRGVGMSDGTYSDGRGELEDTMTVLDWIQSVNDHCRPVIIAGYSFGCWIGLQLLMRRPAIRGFVAVCPPANVYDFSFMSPCPVPGLVVMGDQDIICSKDEVDKFVERLNLQKGVSVDYEVIEGADHMFTGKIEELRAIIKDYISDMSLMAKIV